MHALLSQLRRQASRYLLGTFSVLDATLALDGFGRETITYTEASTCKGQLSAASGSEQRLLDSLTDSGTERKTAVKLSLPWGTPITAGQFVEDATGTVWNVAAVVTPSTLGVTQEVLLTRTEYSRGR